MPKHHVLTPFKVSDTLHKPGGDPIDVDPELVELLQAEGHIGGAIAEGDGNTGGDADGVRIPPPNPPPARIPLPPKAATNPTAKGAPKKSAAKKSASK